MADHDHSAIKEQMTVVGADGVHIGTVDHLDGERIKLTKADSGDGKHHYLDHIPRVLTYVRQVAGRYAVFHPLLRLLDQAGRVPRADGYSF